jgi:hypothetical protein
VKENRKENEDAEEKAVISSGGQRCWMGSREESFSFLKHF